MCRESGNKINFRTFRRQEDKFQPLDIVQLLSSLLTICKNYRQRIQIVGLKLPPTLINDSAILSSRGFFLEVVAAEQSEIEFSR